MVKNRTPRPTEEQQAVLVGAIRKGLAQPAGTNQPDAPIQHCLHQSLTTAAKNYKTRSGKPLPIGPIIALMPHEDEICAGLRTKTPEWIIDTAWQWAEDANDSNDHGMAELARIYRNLRDSAKNGK